MQSLQLKDAKASLSAVVEHVSNGGEAITITKHGRAAAVILSFAEWERLSSVPSFGRLLMSSGLRDGDLPERDKTPLRELDL